MKKTARIEYTKEVRGTAVRKASEVSAEESNLGDVVNRRIDKLVNAGAFNFDVRYELP
jgi:hypothetical protein